MAGFLESYKKKCSPSLAARGIVGIPNYIFIVARATHSVNSHP